MTPTATNHDPATPATVADTGKIRLGAGWGLLPPVSPSVSSPGKVRDAGKIRLGAGWGLLPPAAH